MERHCRFSLTWLRCKSRDAAVENKVTDQADGLRRLMASKAGRQVAVVHCEPVAGVSSLTPNLAAALKQQGQDVLPLTEHGGPQSTPVKRGGLLVLIDAALDSEGALSPSAAQSDHVLVAFQASAASITQAYLCIKRLHYAHALQRMKVLVYGAADAAEAKRLLANLATTASRYLAVALEPAGWVRADPLLAQAQRLGLPVVEAFQASPAARDFRHIASNLLQWPCPSTAERTTSMLCGSPARGEPQPVPEMH
jgi:flagellar biosynthesis protein FlhG